MSVPKFLTFIHSNKCNQLSLVTQIWVYGNSFESFLVAVVVPDQKALEDWAVNHHVTGDFNSLCENLKARKYILDELNNTVQKHQVRICFSWLLLMSCQIMSSYLT